MELDGCTLSSGWLPGRVGPVLERNAVRLQEKSPQGEGRRDCGKVPPCPLSLPPPNKG